jgi:hypothetical protein
LTVEVEVVFSSMTIYEKCNEILTDHSSQPPRSFDDETPTTQKSCVRVVCCVFYLGSGLLVRCALMDERADERLLWRRKKESSWGMVLPIVGMFIRFKDTY